MGLGRDLPTALSACREVDKLLKMSPRLTSPRVSSCRSHSVLEHLSTLLVAVRMLTKLRGVPFLEELGVLSAFQCFTLGVISYL